MHSETLTRQYEQALTLAEAGQYGQALEQMLGYLKASPSDGKALNDAGTILFCMQRGTEAIAYFEKALTVCRGDELTQVYWNLCEAYLQEGWPEKAALLFDAMRHQGILNADILNRAAEAFLQKKNMGGAVETLLTSLSLYPEQDVLKPMLEIIRNHRTPVTILADADNMLVHTVRQTLEKRLPLKTVFATHPQSIADTMRQSQTVILVGAGMSLVQGLNQPRGPKVFVVLNESDLYHSWMTQVHWAAADAVLACAPAEVIEDFKERTGIRTVTTAQSAVEAEARPQQEKKPGKRIAAIGPWTLRHNPMFLLQCFQKLHYLDADMRLHLAGEFEDAGLERYIKDTAEAMDLGTVVFFDGPVKNFNKWLKDKHFIVSTAIDSSALAGVWAGMACGLKPVVHRFAGSESMVAGGYVFTLAEEFCKQIQSDRFEPAVYRQMAQDQFEKNGLTRKLHSILCRMEQAANESSADSLFVQQSPVIQTSLFRPDAPAPMPVEHAPAAAVQPSITTLAEQALSASRTLREMMHNSPSSSEPAPLLNSPVSMGGLSIEPFLEAEPSAVPFAART
jgi:tetratricopeptide (TPR) repeat protein